MKQSNKLKGTFWSRFIFSEQTRMKNKNKNKKIQKRNSKSKKIGKRFGIANKFKKMKSKFIEFSHIRKNRKINQIFILNWNILELLLV